MAEDLRQRLLLGKRRPCSYRTYGLSPRSMGPCGSGPSSTFRCGWVRLGAADPLSIALQRAFRQQPRRWSYAGGMSLFRLEKPVTLTAPTVVAALDSWVDAGAAATTAAAHLVEGGDVLATFDADAIFDYRARRPTLEIADGRPSKLTWPELTLRRSVIGGHELLVLTGPEPDYRWHTLSDELVELAKTFGVVEWISLGSIPAAVPHTRGVPVLGTESRPGLLRGEVRAGPAGLLRVPAAAISVIDIAIAESGIPTVGYFAQVPHYISGALSGRGHRADARRGAAHRRGSGTRRSHGGGRPAAPPP